MYIGTTEVVDNDGLHGARERSGTIGLKAGKHAISVVFFEAGGDEVLTVSYAGPGITKQAVPSSALFRSEGGTTSPGTLTKATGTTFGTAAWVHCTSCSADKAFDGNTATYFDANDANGAYTGIDAGSARVIKRIRFYPRSSNLERMTGGKFQGSNTSSSSGFVDLYTVPSQPTNAWQQVDITNTTGYRYLRYLAPNGGYGNVAEVEFYYEAGGAARESFELSEADLKSEITLFPNPASENLNIRIYSKERGKAQVLLRNAVNQTVVNRDFQLERGENVLTVRTGHLRKGLYMLSVSNNLKRNFRKVLIK